MSSGNRGEHPDPPLETSQLRAIYESALDAFLIADDEGRYVSANPAACALLGLPEADILGHRVADFMAPGFDFAQAWHAFLGQGRGRGEMTLVRPDGSTLDVEYSAISNVLPGRHLSILRDVTDRKRAEDALELLAATGQLLSESLDYHGTLQNVAQLALPFLADWCVLDLLSEEGVLERLVTLHAEPAKQHLVEELKRFPPLGDGPGTAEVFRRGEPLLSPDGDPELLRRLSRDADHLRALEPLEIHSLVIVPLIARGRRLGLWSFIRSQAGRPYGEADLRLAETLARRAALAIDNARLYRQAAAANQAKDRFLAMLSHELRTPLTPVLALVSKLERAAAPGEALHRDLSVIRKNVELEARLIDDLLDLTRIARGKIELHSEAVPIHPLLEHAIQICCAEAVAAGLLTISVELLASDPLAWGDGSRLTQVFWNLLSNAVKFTPAGGAIRVRTAIETAGGVPVVAVEIADTGLGIDPAVLPRIFDAFEQGEIAVTRQFGGLGLGLAVSKAILDVHGGSLAAASGGKGKGTTMTARVPLYQGGAAEAPRDAPRAAAGDLPGSGERPLSILLVEDHADTADAVADLLRDLGHRVEVAGSVAAALAAAGPRIDLVISDLGLPDGSGLDLMRALKASHGLRGIALSGYGTEEDRRQSEAAGFTAHLTKPVSLDTLLAEIRRAGLDVLGSRQS
jgi:PAS domain S-box-containing protein